MEKSQQSTGGMRCSYKMADAWGNGGRMALVRHLVPNKILQMPSGNRPFLFVDEKYPLKTPRRT